LTSYINDGFALPPVAEFEKLITPRTRAIVICNPNNRRVISIAGGDGDPEGYPVIRHGLYLFSDEATGTSVIPGNISVQ